MAKYCLDSNILIRACYVGSKESDFLRRLVSSDDQIVIPITVLAEVLTRSSKAEEQKFEAIFKLSKIIVIDEEIARLAAKLRRRTIHKSKKVFLQDCYIAATALIYNAQLATHNKADFKLLGVELAKF